jgi:hypothetical protein
LRPRGVPCRKLSLPPPTPGLFSCPLFPQSRKKIVGSPQRKWREEKERWGGLARGLIFGRWRACKGCASLAKD